MYVICYFVGKIVGNYVFPRCRFDRVFMFACNLSCMIYCIKFTNWLLLTKSNTVRKILAIKNLVIIRALSHIIQSTITKISHSKI